METELVQVEVNAGDLGVLHNLGHTLGGTSSLDGVTIDELSFLGRLTVSLEDVNVLNWVLGLTLSINHLNVLHGINNHVGEEVSLTEQKLGAHGGFGSVDKTFTGEGIGLDSEVLSDKVDRLLKGKTVAAHDGGGMNLVLNKLVGSLQKLGSEDDNGGGTITDFTILDLGKFDENFGSGVGYLELLKNCGAIIGDGDIADIVDKHLI